MTLVIGLTGGIGSGKSAAADMFEELGATVIDTDQISHSLTAPGGSAIPAIMEAFGREYVREDGALDRPRMRNVVFSDSAAKTRLERILHPLIAAEAANRLAQAAMAPYCILEVPLLFESGNYRDRIDRVAVVDCEETQQIQRTMARSGLSEAEVRAIMAKQLGREERLRRADDVISNTGDLSCMREQIVSLDARYRAKAEKPL